ncbi:hypothetical protein ACIRUY_16475 [Streptomyces erythrochromogenes]|uniref:hypothetical protein n=1 Tax=Streptomyces erythrochromogenes TaxID=285574 RepID=UPI0037FE8C80
MSNPTSVSTFGLRFVIPKHSYAIEQWAEVCPFVDGRDLLEQIHPDGTSSCSARHLLRPAARWPFAASDEPRRIELSNNDCVTDCCGGLFVTIRRQGDRVLWTSWENTHDIRVPLPDDLYFDAAQYDAELARAGADTGWEGPVDTAARLVAGELAARTAREDGDPAVFTVTPERTEPARVTVRLGRRGAPSVQEEVLVRELLVTGDEPVGDLVRRFVLRITAEDLLPDPAA